MMVSGFDFFRTQLAIKMHFTSDYDIFKYCGRVHGVKDTFEKKSNKSLFEKWGKMVKSDEDTINLCVANQLVAGNNWVYDPIQDGIEVFREWKASHEALTRNVSLDLSKLKTLIDQKKVKHNDNFFQKTEKGNFPPLLQLYMAHRILPDTVVAIDMYHKQFLDEWEIEFAGDPTALNRVKQLKKFKPFINKKTAKILNNAVTDFFNTKE